MLYLGMDPPGVGAVKGAPIGAGVEIFSGVEFAQHAKKYYPIPLTAHPPTLSPEGAAMLLPLPHGECGGCGGQSLPPGVWGPSPHPLIKGATSPHTLLSMADVKKTGDSAKAPYRGTQGPLWLCG